MANEKITDFPGANLPLDGAEVIPLVQGGDNVQATVDDVNAAALPIILATGQALAGNSPSRPSIAMSGGDQIQLEGYDTTGHGSQVGAITFDSVGLPSIQGNMRVTGSTTATKGFIFPSTDPHIVGSWWDNAGTLTKSAG